MAYIGNQPTTVAFLTDQFSGTGSQTAFTLSAAPANTNSIIVAISGVLQDPSTYSVSGTTLTFSAAPPAGTGNISVRFLGIPASGVTTTAYRTVTEFTATAGQTTFTPPSYTVGYINVYRNGALLGTADYTATNGTTVVLASAASSGDLVVVESFYVSSVLNAIPATANAVTDTYLNTGAVTTAKIADANVTQAKLASGVAGNGPAFYVYPSSGTSCTNNAQTKVLFQTELYDTNNCFASSTFTPNVAGYYQFTAGINFNSASSVQLTLKKNGSDFTYGSYPNATSNTNLYVNSSFFAYANGTTDYFEIYVYQASGGAITNNAGQAYTFWSGALVRAA